MFEYIVDEELALQLVAPHDAEALFALVDASRPYLRQWLPWVDATRTVADVHAFIEAVRQRYDREDAVTCCIRWQGRTAGIIGLNRIDWVNFKTEIGYWLCPDGQGRGLMTKSCRALVNHAFSELGLNRVEIRAAPGNAKSLAIPQRLGFQREGVLRQTERLYDRYVDHVVYAMLRHEWEALTSRQSEKDS